MAQNYLSDDDVFGPSQTQYLTDDDVFGVSDTPAAGPQKDSVLGDMASAYGVGSNILLRSLGSIYGLATGNMDNAAVRQGDSGIEFWQGRKSATLAGAEEARSAVVDAADNEWAKFGQSVWQTVKNGRLLASTIFEQVPMTVGPGAVGRGMHLTAKALGAGAKTAGGVGVGGAIASGAGLMAADVGERVYSDLLDLPPGLWPQNPDFIALADEIGEEEAKKELSLRYARNAAAAASALSVGSQFVPGGRTVERVLGGGKRGSGGIAGRVAAGALGEGLQEIIEEGGGQAIGNFTISKVDPNQSLSEGVGEASGLALVGGGALGGAAGLAGRGRRDEAGEDKLAEEVNRQLRAMRQRDIEAEAEAAAQEAYNAGGDNLDAEIARNEAFIRMEGQALQDATAQPLSPTQAPQTTGDGIPFNPYQQTMQDPLRADSISVDGRRITPEPQRDPNTIDYQPGQPAPRELSLVDMARQDQGNTIDFTPPSVIDEKASAVERLIAERSQVVPAETPAAPQQAPQAVPAGDRITVWTGRRGDGYPTQGMAQAAVPRREKDRPDLDWRVEQMPSGKFQLVGYGQPRGIGQEAGAGQDVAATEQAGPVSTQPAEGYAPPVAAAHAEPSAVDRAHAEMAKLIAKKKKRKAVNADKDSILRAIAKLGGIKPDWKIDITGDNKNKFIPGVGSVFSPTGTSIDDMASRLMQEGYFTEQDMANLDGRDKLYAAIQKELGGTKVYALGSARAEADMEAAWQERMQDEMAAEQDRLEQRYEEIAREHGQDAANLAREYDDAAAAHAETLYQEIEAYEQRQQERDDARATDGEPSLTEAEAAARDDEVRTDDDGSDRDPRGQTGQAEGAGGKGFVLATETEAQRVAREQTEQESTNQAKRESDKSAEADRKARESKADKARAEETVDDFQLGQTADQQLSGVPDMFSDTAPKSLRSAQEARAKQKAEAKLKGITISETVLDEAGNEVVIEQSADAAIRQIDKRISVLQSLLNCVSA